MDKKSIIDFLIVQEFLRKVGGDYAADLVRVCDCKARSKRLVTDEVIGKEFKNLKITEIRAILNRLHYRGIAHYQKTRNPKTGWYSYSWGVNKRRILELILEEQKEGIEKLEQKIEFEKNYVFFGCPGGCDNLPFEIAAEYQFKCPNCGKGMTSMDNKKVLGSMKKKAKIMRDEIGQMQEMFSKTQNVGQVRQL